jgi:enamine deaminase RidA (YjgF/YER057c/UK114 family)
MLNESIEYGKSFSRGMRVELGDFVLIEISGTASVDNEGKTYCPDNFKAQVKRTYDNITALLESEGADWHDVVKTRCYIKDMKYYGEFNEYRNAFYKEQQLDPFPASVGVQAVLCRPDLLVEIEATAIIRK